MAGCCGEGSSPSASKLKALRDQVTRVLFFAQGNLLGRAERLAADAFGNLLDLAAGFEERSNLIVDRFAGFNGWSWLCFAGGCFYAHGGH
ncbi:MMS19 nucleotide excision repair protein [Pseudomonas sp. IT-P44]